MCAGEATRLLAWLVKNSRAAVVMRNLVRAEAVPHLVAMGTSEHKTIIVEKETAGFLRNNNSKKRS